MKSQIQGGEERSLTAYLFPGQGSHVPGMGKELYKASLSAREVFERADDALDLPLSQLMFSGSPEELERTVNSQPAILTMSIACLKTLEETQREESLPKPIFLAGHSLGEYTALVASNVLDLEDAVRLVRERGRLMQEASDRVPTSMAAVLGLDEITLEEVCRATGTQISTINSNDQIVISGERIALAHALDLAAMRGAHQTIPLRVSGAFHSEFMRPAEEGMINALEEVAFRDPVVPVVANCTGEPLTTADQIKEELSYQLCNRIQWKRSVEFMVEAGVSNFVEMGPGRILSALVRRINPQVQVTPVNNLASIKRFAA